MNGWDGWGSPLGDIGEEGHHLSKQDFGIGALAYSTGRVSHDEDVRREIAAVLSANDEFERLYTPVCFRPRLRKERHAHRAN